MINLHLNRTTPPGAVSFKGRQSGKQERRKKLNIPVLLSSSAGVMGALALMKRKDITSIKKLFMSDYGPKEIIGIGCGSLAGGLAGGLATDRENKRAKFKEATYQLITNIISPTVFVAGFLKLTKNSKHPLIAKALSVIAGLSIGITTGSFVANRLIKTIFNDKGFRRRVGVKDVSIHVDDLPMALALTRTRALMIDRLTPAAMIIPGYAAGSKTQRRKGNENKALQTYLENRNK